jgi:hypothetical protein
VQQQHQGDVTNKYKNIVVGTIWDIFAVDRPFACFWAPMPDDFSQERKNYEKRLKFYTRGPNIEFIKSRQRREGKKAPGNEVDINT